MTTDWHCIEKVPLEVNAFAREDASEIHPLRQMTVTVLESKGTRREKSSGGTGLGMLDPLSQAFDGSDPLSQFARQASLEVDPLSQIAAEYELSSSGGKKMDSPLEEAIEPWSSRRSAILSKYTTAERLSIVTSFVSGSESIKAQTTMTEKVKHRLEQLDDFADGSYHMQDVTQQEYVSRIEQLNQELVQAWNNDHRVTALKIAIQCSKLLADTSVMQFYPSQFVLITDILDIFGKLVYDRLKVKAGYIRPGSTNPTALPDNFTPDMVPEMAKETCLNWFYKIASIRELLPRFYVEAAILKCYSFLTSTEFNLALLRLTRIIRGIGDPLVSIYARCYLCRVGMTVTSDRAYISENLTDLFTVYHTMFSPRLKNELTRQRLEMPTYLSLYIPALDWIMQGMAVHTPDAVLDQILDKCLAQKNNGLLLNSVMTSFSCNFISRRAVKLLLAISDNSLSEGFPQAQLLRALGSCLVMATTLPEERQQVWADAMRLIGEIKLPGQFILALESWAELTSTAYNLSHVAAILEDLLMHMGQNRVFEQHYGELQAVVDKIVFNSKDLEGLLTLDNFMPVLDLFQKESVKLDVCRNIMMVYRDKIEAKTNDPVTTNALMYICRVLNDSVNALTVDDERRQIGGLISHMIKQVDFGRDFESQLAFYVDARAAFLNLDVVYATLIHCVNNLAMETRRMIRGQHSKKTAAFVRACAAYCFITIPSIVAVATRMDLYLVSASVALQNLCLGQADSCLEAAIELLPDLPAVVEVDGKPKSNEAYLISYVGSLLSTLIVVPDSPDRGVLFLLRLLLDKLNLYQFDEIHCQCEATLITIYLGILDMLSTAAQDAYPYHIPGIVSNDELYGSDPKFIAEIDGLSSKVADKILINLKLLADKGQLKVQSNLALELFTRIVRSTDITRDKQFTLAVNLWNLVTKNKALLDAKALLAVLAIVEQTRTAQGNTVLGKRLEELVMRMRNKL
ncbi:VPS35 endosomal protein sorting factor-like [Phlebotomus argentipes]|uniref:VPS35 endosomal protein sorting factor-like n=1 Tax=Phlebotomus argentipes TaxID=94469 RepID=UPI0028931C12|nr:VPS35 endosomal protein sorting factor-like [Phlebotomus argentipes]